jgi:hypothetical protein
MPLVVVRENRIRKSPAVKEIGRISERQPGESNESLQRGHYVKSKSDSVVKKINHQAV